MTGASGTSEASGANGVNGVKDTPAAATASDAQRAENGAGAHAGSRILVVDADERRRRVLTWVLREQGYETIGIANGAAMIDALGRETSDLVVLDAGDGGGDARELLARLKSDARWREVPVVVTAPDAPELTVDSLRMGADDALSGPIRLPELLARIEARLRTRRVLKEREVELQRAREEAASTHELVDIVHEVAGEFSASAMYRILARRVAHALEIRHCSVVLVNGEGKGTVVAAHEDPRVTALPIDLDRYPEITAALQTGRPVLIEDASVHPVLAAAREQWAREGRPVHLRSLLTLPFALDRRRQGVLFLRTADHERTLTKADCDFAEVVLKAAISSIKRGQLVERTRADNRRLSELAALDPLTHLFNRRAFLERLTAELDRARRYDHVVSLLVVDIDHFKAVNDSAGHLAGDQVLAEVGAMLQAGVRAVDVVARYGGEEFVVLLPETPLDGAVRFAERLREQLEEHRFVVREDAEPIRLTASVGVSCFPAPQVDSADDLFARADEALYRAKQSGRNQVCS